MTQHSQFAATPPREKQAYQALLGEIHRRALRRGDRLPPQEELRQAIGFSHFTLSRAMARLVNQGVVVRKPRVGTVIADPAAGMPPSCTVGILLNWQVGTHPSPFFAQLLCLLQVELLTAGCHCRTYARSIGPGERPDQFQDYPRLAEDVAARRLDGVLVIGVLDEKDRAAAEERGIAVCYAGGCDLSTYGAVIDNGTFGRAAVARLRRDGARRLAGITAGADPAYSRVQDEARAAVAALTTDGATYEALYTACAGIHGGQRAAGMLLARPPGERPDGLIIHDDHIALGLAQVLKMESDYAPALAVVTHRASPLAFALPALRFELDEAHLAARGVRMLLERLRNPQLPPRLELIVPQLVNEQAEHLPEPIMALA